METEIKNITLFTITPKKMKCLDICVTKHVYNLYAENYKMLMKEIRKDPNKCKDYMWYCVHGLQDQIYSKEEYKYKEYMSVLPKLTYRFHVIPI